MPAWPKVPKDIKSRLQENPLCTSQEPDWELTEMQCVCPHTQRLGREGPATPEPPFAPTRRSAARQRWSSSSIVSWPTSSGCWWRVSTYTPCWPSPSSPNGSTSGGTYSSAGVWYQGGGWAGKAHWVVGGCGPSLLMRCSTNSDGCPQNV